MPLTYTILTDLNLVYVRYQGVCTVWESQANFDRYQKDPKAHPDQRHLVDLSRLVEFHRPPVELMKHQTQKLDIFMKARQPILAVYFAPNRMTQSMARASLKSWEGLSCLIGMIAQEEKQALEMLGLTASSIDDLLMKRA